MVLIPSESELRRLSDAELLAAWGNAAAEAIAAARSKADADLILARYERQLFERLLAGKPGG